MGVRGGGGGGGRGEGEGDCSVFVTIIFSALPSGGFRPLLKLTVFCAYVKGVMLAKIDPMQSVCTNFS